MVYNFKDGQFKFFLALYGSWANDRRIVFRVRIDRNPIERAKEKQIKCYDRIVPCTDQTFIKMWLESHADYPILSTE